MFRLIIKAIILFQLWEVRGCLKATVGYQHFKWSDEKNINYLGSYCYADMVDEYYERHRSIDK